MDTDTVRRTAALGKTVNIALGHVGEMTGTALTRASQVLRCRWGERLGQAVRAAGRGWADKAVEVAHRDRDRLTTPESRGAGRPPGNVPEA